MKFIRAISLYAFGIIAAVIGCIVMFPVSRMIKRRTLAYLVLSRYWSKTVVFLSGVPVKVYGVENVPKNETLVIVSNHQGAADIVLLLACLPVYFRYIVKKELYRVPIFNLYMSLAGYIGADRGSAGSSHKMFATALDALASGDSIAIFPEGTRSRDGKLQPFKRGSLLLAFKARVRVLPVAVSGSFGFLPPKSMIYEKVPIKVTVGKPVSLEQYGTKYEKALEDIHDIIKEML